MHHMLTEEAAAALEQLDDGACMNTTHRLARELIAAGLAFDGFGRLEISEAGRRARRGSTARAFVIDDPNIADLSPKPAPKFELPPVAPEPELLAVETRDPSTKSRVMRAAGVANGKCGIWVDQLWMAAFIEAFEADQ